MEYRKELRNFEMSLAALKAMRSSLSVNMARIFFAVAQNPRMPMRKLEELTGLSQASISRNMSALGKVDRYGKPGADLVVAVIDPNEQRRKLCELTPKGKAVLNAVMETYQKGTPPTKKIEAIRSNPPREKRFCPYCGKYLGAENKPECCAA